MTMRSMSGSRFVAHSEKPYRPIKTRTPDQNE
jgi:hypothetical protein